MAKTNGSGETDPMIKRMEELEAQLQAANLRNAALETEVLTKRLPSDVESHGTGTGPKANLADQPVGDDYLFEVKCNDPSAGLPTKTVRCCDESEAIRWYAVTTPHPSQPGKALDTAKYRCIATNKEEEKRVKRIALEHRKVYLRNQYKNGSKELTTEELELIGVLQGHG